MSNVIQQNKNLKKLETRLQNIKLTKTENYSRTLGQNIIKHIEKPKNTSNLMKANV